MNNNNNNNNNNKENQKMYSRQIILPEIGIEGQEKINRAKIAIIGMGALGTVAAELLVRSGVKHLTLIDRDIIEISNLQRQALYTKKDVGKLKAQTAKEKLLEVNPNANIDVKNVHLFAENINQIKTPTLILDCTDNIQTRLLINDYCKKNNIKWIYCSAIKTKAMLMYISPEGPCLQCFLPKDAQGETCQGAGVLNTATHIIASMQATLALKLILEKRVASNELITYDSWNNKILKLKVREKENCLCCNRNYKYLEQKDGNQTKKFCSSGNYQIIGNKTLDLKKLYKNVTQSNQEDKIVFDGNVLIVKNINYTILIFPDSRALIKTNSLQQAETLYSKYIGN